MVDVVHDKPAAREVAIAHGRPRASTHASINDEIDKMRHSAANALLERTDMIIVARVRASMATPATLLNTGQRA